MPRPRQWLLLCGRPVVGLLVGGGFRAGARGAFRAGGRCEVPEALLAASSVSSLAWGVPARVLVDRVGRKLRYVARVYPREEEAGYQFRSEGDYYKHLRSSHFALTWRRGGWVTMRHYEILASGSIPYFPDLEHMPACIAPELPRRQILGAMSLWAPKRGSPRELARGGGGGNGASWRPELRRAAAALLNYTRANLMPWHTGTRFLNVVRRDPLFPRRPPQNLTRVLFLNRFDAEPPCDVESVNNEGADYFRDSLFYGLRSLGLLVVDVPRLDHLYADLPRDRPCRRHGNCFWSRVLPAPGARAESFEERGFSFNVDVDGLRRDWLSLLRSHFFDHVVFSTRGAYFPYNWPVICARVPELNMLSKLIRWMNEAGYSPRQVSMLHGKDGPFLTSWFLRLPRLLQSAHQFIREGIVDDWDGASQMEFHVDCDGCSR